MHRARTLYTSACKRAIAALDRIGMRLHVDVPLRAGLSSARVRAGAAAGSFAKTQEAPDADIISSIKLFLTGFNV